MLFGGVIKISKIEKMHFSSYLHACDESSSYLASRSYEALENKFFTKNCSLAPPLQGDILFFQKRIRFRKVRRTKNVSKMVLIRLQEVEFESVLQFVALASFVFDETWCVQVTTCQVYDHQIRRL